MKARRLVSAAALAVVLCTSAPVAFAGGDTQPWDSPSPDNTVADVLDAAIAGVQAALTVL